MVILIGYKVRQLKFWRSLENRLKRQEAQISQLKKKEVLLEATEPKAPGGGYDHNARPISMSKLYDMLEYHRSLRDEMQRILAKSEQLAQKLEQVEKQREVLKLRQKNIRARVEAYCQFLEKFDLIVREKDNFSTIAGLISIYIISMNDREKALKDVIDEKRRLLKKHMTLQELKDSRVNQIRACDIPRFFQLNEILEGYRRSAEEGEAMIVENRGRVWGIRKVLSATNIEPTEERHLLNNSG
jgi:hypothetical protein